MFELFARRRERLAFIEKISEGDGAESAEGQLDMSPNKSNVNNYVTSSDIRVGLLLVGVGLGVAIVAVTNFSVAVAPPSADEELSMSFVNHYTSILYPACAAIFGGIGLVIAYFIERKDSKKNRIKRSNNWCRIRTKNYIQFCSSNCGRSYRWLAD